MNSPPRSVRTFTTAAYIAGLLAVIDGGRLLGALIADADNVQTGAIRAGFLAAIALALVFVLIARVTRLEDRVKRLEATADTERESA